MKFHHLVPGVGSKPIWCPTFFSESVGYAIVTLKLASEISEIRCMPKGGILWCEMLRMSNAPIMLLG